MDVADLLARAAAMVPADVVNEAGATVADVREYLDHDEWEAALYLLMDLGTSWRPTTAWWDLLVDSAETMRHPAAAAWCHWGRWESIHGIVRAELRLLSPSEGGRRTPTQARASSDRSGTSADGRPGRPNLLVARIWVEPAPAMPPGATGPVRLGPLSPALWRHLRPGMTITMHEGQPTVGTATIIEASDARTSADQCDHRHAACWPGANRRRSCFPRSLVTLVAVR
ncbi:hypothetical protein [Polymorphospora rubra]|nr:hypothetical protein [Polymorphospora rubra]